MYELIVKVMGELESNIKRFTNNRSKIKEARK